MAMVTRKEAFRQAYTNLDLSPLLSPRALKAFRVDYGDEVLAELEQMVEDDEAEDGKTIFSGHRGCGKSTLLAEFGRQCEQHGFFVVSFSIADTIEMSDINYINILFSVAVNMMEAAEIRDIEISASAKQAFREWFATKTQTSIKDQTFLDLLHSLHVLEYRNGKIWYDLHPIVKDLLVLKGMVKG